MPIRQGPRPLTVHLSVAMSLLLSSKVGLRLLNSSWFQWQPELLPRVHDLREKLQGVPQKYLEQALQQEIIAQSSLLFKGLESYRCHPYRRDLQEPSILWQEGSSRLLDYGKVGDKPVLFVPSLINRSYILDLSEKCSLMRWLALKGIRPFLLDFGPPNTLEAQWSLNDYITCRVERAFEVVVQQYGERVGVVGYCMGGVLALALATRRPQPISQLVLIATPWDFHVKENLNLLSLLGLWGTLFMIETQVWETLPVDVLQTMFMTIDPWQTLQKFQRFARMNPSSEIALQFVALEDWLNDGINLALPVAKECLWSWYGRNDLVSLQWRLDGKVVDPKQVVCPTLILVPGQDRIVPPASARAIGHQLTNVTLLEPSLGHIGMIVSRGARKRVWNPLLHFLKHGNLP